MFILTPVSDRAKEWVNQNVCFESWQQYGDSICMERDYSVDIVNGMTDEGFVYPKDYTTYPELRKVN